MSDEARKLLAAMKGLPPPEPEPDPLPALPLPKRRGPLGGAQLAVSPKIWIRIPLADYEWLCDRAHKEGTFLYDQFRKAVRAYVTAQSAPPPTSGGDHA